jgi:hypothetical protein
MGGKFVSKSTWRLCSMVHTLGRKARNQRYDFIQFFNAQLKYLQKE